MVSKDHTCEDGETPNDFPPRPQQLDTPPFRSYGRGVLNVSPGEVRRSNSPFLGHLGGGYLASSLEGRHFNNPPPSKPSVLGVFGSSPPLGRKTSHPLGRWLLLCNHFPFEDRRLHEPPPPDHYNPRFPPVISFPSCLIPYLFLFWKGAIPFLSLLPLPMSCPVSLPHMTCPISPTHL